MDSKNFPVSLDSMKLFVGGLLKVTLYLNLADYIHGTRDCFLSDMKYCFKYSGPNSIKAQNCYLCQNSSGAQARCQQEAFYEQHIYFMGFISMCVMKICVSVRLLFRVKKCFVGMQNPDLVQGVKNSHSLKNISFWNLF